ncbi:MAG: hypothetical protein K2P58_10565 [Hyphomonadaceae bacterium]|nr:hypothetical protein [Hyphomonadaceae bacterium]
MRLRAAVIAALSLAACAPDRTPQQPYTIEGFGWLEGCWLSRDGAVERWEPAASAMMSGSNLYPQSDGSQIALTLQIEAGADGIVFSSRSPEGATAHYTLASRGEGEAAFENADNTGPQRIAYRRDNGALVVALSESLDPAAPSFVTRYQPCANDTIAP